MRTFGRMVLTVGLVAALAGSAAAQRQPGGQGRGGFGGGFGGGGVGFLIRSEAVQKELTMDKDQVDKATEAAKKVQDKHADEFTKLRDLPREEQTPKRQELTKTVNEETLKAVSEVLKPEQVTRLKQIELQRAGFAAFSRAEVQTALKLNDEQKEKVKTISDEANKQMRELFGQGGQGGRPQRGQGGAGGAGGRGRGQGGPNADKIATLRKETNEKLVAVLTDDQKATWKELTGKPFELPTTRPAPKKDD
jgi:hypothetical protein